MAERTMINRRRYALHGGVSQNGSVLLFLIVAMLLISTLSIPLFRLIPTSSFSDVDMGHEVQAMYLAQGGLHYADVWLCSFPVAQDRTLDHYSLGSVGEFSLSATVQDPVNRIYSVTSTGTAHSGSPFQAVYLTRRVVDCGSATPEPTPVDPGYYVTYSGGGGQYAIPSGGYIDGSVYGHSVEVHPNSEITGNIISQTSITLGSGVTVGGYVCSSGGNVILRSAGVTVGGDINASGNVVLNSGATAQKNVFATGYVTLEPSGSQVFKDIHAGQYVSLGSGCTAHQNVFAGGALSMSNSGSLVKNNVHAGGNVNLDNNTHINGSVWAGGTINRPANVGGAALGNQSSPPRIPPTPPATCPEVPVPRMQTFSAGTTDFNMPPSWQQTHATITPGAYRDLNWEGGVTLTMRAGTCRNVGDPGCYYFRNFNGGSWTQTLRLDFSTGDDITVFATGDILHTGPVQVSTDGVIWQSITGMNLNSAKELAKRVYWETHGSFEITGSNGIRQWFGTVLAENDVSIPSGAEVIGAFATVNGDVSAGANPSIIYVLARFANDHW
jgi:hypothetical protein